MSGKVITRRESRETAVGLIYEYEFGKDRDKNEIYELALEERFDNVNDDFAKELFFETVDHLEEIDAKISECADNWRIDRIGRVPLAILRLAACEIGYFPEIPVEITVNEALELTREFDTENSVAFVNGVLGKVSKGVSKPDARKKPKKSEESEETENSEKSGTEKTDGE